MSSRKNTTSLRLSPTMQLCLQIKADCKERPKTYIIEKALEEYFYSHRDEDITYTIFKETNQEKYTDQEIYEMIKNINL